MLPSGTICTNLRSSSQFCYGQKEASSRYTGPVKSEVREVRNELHVGEPAAPLAGLSADSVQLVWLDVRGGLLLREASPLGPTQLSLFGSPEPLDSFTEVTAETFKRLVEQIHRLLRRTGHLFAFTDLATTHKARIVLDAVFGANRFVTEFVTARSSRDSDRPISHDVIIVYAKSPEALLRTVLTDVPAHRLKSLYRYVEAGTGRLYALGDCVNPNLARTDLKYEWKGVVRVWRWPRSTMATLDASGKLVYTRGGLPRIKRYADEVSKRPLGSIWGDVNADQPTNSDAVLMKRIVELGSDNGDTILDAYATSGHLVAVAGESNRTWIAVAPTHRAASTVRNDLRNKLGRVADETYIFHGPQSVSDAHDMLRVAPLEFKFWVLGVLGAVWPVKLRHTDAGISGRLPVSYSSSPVPVIVKFADIDQRSIREFKEILRREKTTSLIVITRNDLSDLAEPHRLPGVPNIFFISVHQLLQSGRSRLLLELELAYGKRRPQKATSGSRARRKSA